ncbi:transposase [Streptomyces sp. Sge12]|uniref:transposase n=1 Tax=Streptomyces sp. Sge12 TaxID=1972846 RepID=UPI003FCCA4E4
MEPLLPQVDGRGRPWRDHRQVVNGVLWRLRTGAPWRDLPERYGPWQTVYERFARWKADGTWARLLEHVQVRDDTEGRVEWTVAVDSAINVFTSTPPAHVKGGCGRGRTGRSGRLADGPGPRPVPRRADHQGPPRRRRPGLPLSIVLTPGNVDDATAFGQVLDGVRVPRADTGRPRTKQPRVLGDKAYSSRAIRYLLRRRGIAVDPRAPRPNSQPPPPRAPRRPAARLRQGALPRLPRPQHGRTMLRTPQAVPRDRDEIRQACRPLPCRRRPGLADPLAPRTSP